MKETRMTRPIYPQHALAATFISGRQRPNKPDAANPAIALWLTTEDQWRRDWRYPTD